jgi:hypothetical protein
MTAIKHACLDNGLEISFSDESNRYFGDYHRICVVVTISCSVGHLTDDELRRRATAVYGEKLEIAKRLVRMGVASAECEQVRNALVDDFMRHASSYLSRPDYPRLLVAAELRKASPRRFHV